MNNYKINSYSTNKTKISKLLCGNFIELGYGIQCEPMFGEMLFNRSFEAFVPYTHINKVWFDLYSNPSNPSDGYEKDWSAFDWWHNGYEHNKWFAAPGGCDEDGEIDDDFDSFICSTPYRNMKLHICSGGIHGKQYLSVENFEVNQYAGLAQRGKYVKKDEIYKFSGYFKLDYGCPEIIIELVPEDDFQNPISQNKFKITSTEWTFYECDLKSSYAGKATFVLWVSKESKLSVDAFSLFAPNTIFGFRHDVVEVIKNQINPSVIRWPGGCFTSFYNWEEATGERNKRTPTSSYFWGGLNYNDIGSLELAGLCEEIGCEQLLCIPINHPKKQYFTSYIKDFYNEKHGYDFPHFAKHEDGIKNALNWLSYLIDDENTEYGSLRAKHGHIRPFNIQYVELENEAHRWFEPLEYANECISYCEAIKNRFPFIKIGVQTYSRFFKDKIPAMLEIVGKKIDFLCDRGWDYENLQYKLNIMRQYNKQNLTNIKYCNTEWAGYPPTMADDDGFNLINANKSFMYSKWFFSISAIRLILMWQREGDDILFTNYSNLANTHSQNVIDTPKDAVKVNCAGKILGLLSGSKACYNLDIENYVYNQNSSFHLQCALNETKNELIVYVVNSKSSNEEICVDFENIEHSYDKVVVKMYYAKNLLAMSKQNNDELKYQQFTINKKFHSNIILQIPKYSFSEICLIKE